FTNLKDDYNKGGAKKAGLKEGDIITKVNNVKITKFSDLKGQLTAKRPGEYVNVIIDRDGEELTKVVKLTKLIKLPVSKVLQTEFEDITNDDKKKFKIESGAKIKRTENIAFKQFDVGEGYILTKINGKKVADAKEAASMLDKTYGSGNRLLLEMISPSGQIERFRY
ncbi:PDZ domain-containing protein, partial [Tenacibaculum sp. L6]|uniref:PDZ domain-containing protein n=1 Tax=Tenacibaculum sp. L6 TaxID=2992764 RepID=UPI00237AC44D